jgi:methylated-DNA-protein-cysteine methyltransferase-like protein
MKSEGNALYRRIYHLVCMVPPGRVATYGQIARLAGRCSARNVGYAMSSVPPESLVPWHRVMNSRGRISVRSDGEPCNAQRQMLESEGIVFGPGGIVDLEIFGWQGPAGEVSDDGQR